MRFKNSRGWPAALVVAVLLFTVCPAYAFEVVRIGGDGSGLVVMKSLEDDFINRFPSVALRFVPGLNSGGARLALPLGIIDIAITSTPGNYGEKLAGAKTFGRSPFVFVTSTTTQAYNVSTEDLIEIYAGRKIQWTGGDRLRLILKPQSDPDTQILKNISPAMTDAVSQAHARPGMRMALSDVEGADAVINTPGALGTTTLAMVVAGKRPLNILSIDGRIPSPRSIPDGTYPWFKTYYVSARPSASAGVRQFFEFVLSKVGREKFASLGYWTEQ